jgi:hypothetical protein
MSENNGARVPWKSIARSAPWVIWGLVALIALLRLKTVTAEDLKNILGALPHLGGPT